MVRITVVIEANSGDGGGGNGGDGSWLSFL